MRHTISFLFLVLTSCTAKGNWQVTHLTGVKKEFDSSRLMYRSRDKMNGIDFEIVTAMNEPRLILSIHTGKLHPYKEDPKKTLVSLKIESKNYFCIAECREGGQKALLPEKFRDLILDALSNGKTIQLFLSGLTTTISSQDFINRLSECRNPPSFLKHFHLPF